MGKRGPQPKPKRPPILTRSGVHQGHTACRENAWKALCEGIWTYAGIAKYVNERSGCNHDHHWAQRSLESQSRLVEAVVDNGAISARAEYLQGLRTDLSAQAVIANNPDVDPRDRIAARKAMTDIRERLAAARGVVTERKGVQVSGDKDNPLYMETVSIDASAVLADEELRRLAASIAARASSRPPESGEPGGPTDAG